MFRAPHSTQECCGAPGGKVDVATVETPPPLRQQTLGHRRFAAGGPGHTPDGERETVTPQWMCLRATRTPDEKEVVRSSEHAISEPAHSSWDS